jgi:HSF-type DNA-binding
MFRASGDWNEECYDSLRNDDDTCVTNLLVQEIDAFLIDSQATIEQATSENERIESRYVEQGNNLTEHIYETSEQENEIMPTRNNHQKSKCDVYPFVEVDQTYHDYTDPVSIEQLLSTEEKFKLDVIVQQQQQQQKQQQQQQPKHQQQQHQQQQQPQHLQQQQHRTSFVSPKRSPFPQALHKLLDDASINGFDDIISWDSHGRSFRIQDPPRFVEEVMPKYFNQSRYPSFQVRFFFFSSSSFST